MGAQMATGFLALLLLCGSPAQATGLVAVSTSKLSPAGITGDVAAALARPFEDPWTVLVGKARTKEQLRDCRDYLRLAGASVETEVPGNQRFFLADAADCQALAILREMRPSQRSFLTSFHLDSRSPAVLPANFYLDLTAADGARVKAAAAAGRSWKSFDPQVRVKALPGGNDPGRLHVRGNGYDARLTEYGRGDFDGDGIEDLLILRTASPRGGTLTDFALFLLTRPSDHAPLKVLKSWNQMY